MLGRRVSAGFFFALFGAAFLWALRAALSPVPAAGSARLPDPEAILAGGRAARRAEELSAVVAAILVEHGLGRGDVRYESVVPPDPAKGVPFPRTSIAVDVRQEVTPVGVALETAAGRLEGATVRREARPDHERLGIRLDAVEVLVLELYPMRLPAGSGGPRIALVIDDVGYAREPVYRLLGRTNRITFAVLPYGPHAGTLAEAAHREGAEIMLHLPMQPEGAEGPAAPGGFSRESMLLPSMSDAELAGVLAEGLARVPHAAGVNNHMGSALTADPTSMRTVMRELASRRLFFLDSRTSPRTVAYRIARESGVPAAERDVFLDDVAEAHAIREQLARLESMALRRGSAIAIGHPYPETVDALLQWLPTLEEKNIELVPVSSLAGLSAPASRP